MFCIIAPSPLSSDESDYSDVEESADVSDSEPSPGNAEARSKREAVEWCTDMYLIFLTYIQYNNNSLLPTHPSEQKVVPRKWKAISRVSRYLQAFLSNHGAQVCVIIFLRIENAFVGHET